MKLGQARACESLDVSEWRPTGNANPQDSRDRSEAAEKLTLSRNPRRARLEVSVAQHAEQVLSGMSQRFESLDYEQTGGFLDGMKRLMV